MPRKSAIKGLPPSIRKKLDRLILDGRLSIDALTEFIASCGVLETPPSRSAVGHYAKDLKEQAKKTALLLKESREMASAIAQELGPESVEGEQGRLLVEMLRTFLFRFISTRNIESEPFKPEDFTKMARALRDMSQAMQMEQDFAKKIQEEARKQVEAEVQERADKLCGMGDLKKLSNEELKKKIAELATGKP